MLRLVVNKLIIHQSRNPGDIFYNVQRKYSNIGELEKIEFVDESAEKVLPIVRLINFVSEKLQKI